MDKAVRADHLYVTADEEYAVSVSENTYVGGNIGYRSEYMPCSGTTSRDVSENTQVRRWYVGYRLGYLQCPDL
jgi:translation elongation factor EF-1alpha